MTPEELLQLRLSEGMPLCRYCGKRAANRPKRMCSSCHSNASIRTLYPSLSKFARHEPPPGSSHDEDGFSMRLPIRKPGELPHRCLWCLRYRCTERLKRCAECDA